MTYRKHLVIFLFLIVLVFMLYRQFSNKPIVLPSEEDVVSVSISRVEDGDILGTVNGSPKILGAIKESALSTSNESTSDAPSVKTYIRLDINTKTEFYLLYLYQKDWHYYVEVPHSGIWQITEAVYDSVNANFPD